MNRNVKVLTLIQLTTMTIVFVGVFIYNTLRPAKSRFALGMVDGVIYSPDDSSVLIDGQILREGENIYGVTVKKIYKNKVEFEKNNKRWEQRVQERPNRGWEEVNQP
jgi:hypothetical protein